MRVPRALTDGQTNVISDLLLDDTAHMSVKIFEIVSLRRQLRYKDVLVLLRSHARTRSFVFHEFFMQIPKISTFKYAN